MKTVLLEITTFSKCKGFETGFYNGITKKSSIWIFGRKFEVDTFEIRFLVHHNQTLTQEGRKLSSCCIISNWIRIESTV